MEENKLCPFRKEIIMTDYKTSGEGYPVDTQYEETFLPCLGEKCAAYWTDIIMMINGCKFFDKTGRIWL